MEFSVYFTEMKYAAIEVEQISLLARMNHARNYQFNTKMQIEAELLHRQIIALEEEKLRLIRDERR